MNAWTIRDEYWEVMFDLFHIMISDTQSTVLCDTQDIKHHDLTIELRQCYLISHADNIATAWEVHIRIQIWSYPLEICILEGAQVLWGSNFVLTMVYDACICHSLHQNDRVVQTGSWQKRKLMSTHRWHCTIQTAWKVEPHSCSILPSENSDASYKSRFQQHLW